ncbi:hypothetical protein K439DRAFT_1621426 [Ramaria rubella]|nr:hypothetical protein K439DRAFT_1621426 [Ramaria rubella]
MSTIAITNFILKIFDRLNSVLSWVGMRLPDTLNVGGIKGLLSVNMALGSHWQSASQKKPGPKSPPVVLPAEKGEYSFLRLPYFIMNTKKAQNSDVGTSEGLILESVPERTDASAHVFKIASTEAPMEPTNAYPRVGATSDSPSFIKPSLTDGSPSNGVGTGSPPNRPALQQIHPNELPALQRSSIHVRVLPNSVLKYRLARFSPCSILSPLRHTISNPSLKERIFPSHGSTSDDATLHPWDEVTPSRKYWDARRTLISALGMMNVQIVPAVVQNQREKLISDDLGYHHSVALNFANTHIADILAAPDIDERVGLPVAEIARRIGTYPAKTERVLRFLCIYHTFQETSPAVFATNRVSVCLKKGHPTAELPLMWADVGFRSATAFSATLRDPRTAHSMRIEDAPKFGEVFSNPTPTPTTVSHVIQESMPSGLGPASISEPKSATVATSPPRATIFEFLARYHDLAWGRWDTEGAVFVEAGASTGHLANAVLPLLKHAKFVNQDRPEVCLQGEKRTTPKSSTLDALRSNQMTFSRGSLSKASIYILSNWPDKEALTILNHIAAAMVPSSRLLVIEIVIVPSLSQSRSPPPAPKDNNIGDAPWPLQKDYRFVNRYPHHQSMELMNLFNGLDRTLDEYVSLFELSGLELVEVHRIRKLASILEVKKKA